MQRHGTAVHGCMQACVVTVCQGLPTLGSAQARLLAFCTLYLHAEGMTVSSLYLQSHVSGITNYSWEVIPGNQLQFVGYWAAGVQDSAECNSMCAASVL